MRRDIASRRPLLAEDRRMWSEGVLVACKILLRPLRSYLFSSTSSRSWTRESTSHAIRSRVHRIIPEIEFTVSGSSRACMGFPSGPRVLSCWAKVLTITAWRSWRVIQENFPENDRAFWSPE